LHGVWEAGVPTISDIHSSAAPGAARMGDRTPEKLSATGALRHEHRAAPAIALVDALIRSLSLVPETQRPRIGGASGGAR
jgi:hypothetical protein